MATKRKITNMNDLDTQLEETASSSAANEFGTKSEFIEIFSRAKNQQDIIDQIKSLHLSDESSIDVSRYPILFLEETYTEKDQFAVGIRLALDSFGVKVTQVRFQMGAYRFNQVSVPIPPSVLNSTRNDLAAFVAERFIANPYAIGFSLRKEESKTSLGVVYPWTLTLFESRDKQQKRVDIVKEYYNKLSEIRPILSAKIKEIKEKKGKVTIQEISDLTSEIHTSMNILWDPAFYTAFIRYNY